MFGLTPDQLISLASSLGALFTAVATFWTVRQIAMQRHASYRPELTFSRTHFEATPDPVLPTSWRGDSASHVSPFAVPLRNVGLGAAKAVSLAWSFPLAETVASVNEAAQRTETPVTFRLRTDRYASIDMESETLGRKTSLWKNQQRASIDFVLPISVERDPINVFLPDAYVMLCSAIFFLSVREKGVGRFEVPALTVNIKYSDIGNREHHATFSLQPSIYFATMEKVTGQIDCTKV
jgi:hypothetical protein